MVVTCYVVVICYVFSSCYVVVIGYVVVTYYAQGSIKKAMDLHSFGTQV